MLNHAIWTNRFGGRQSVLGEQLDLGARLSTVIGVLPPRFDLDGEERVYLPLEPWATSNASTQDRGNHQGIYVLARLRPEVEHDQARAEIELAGESRALFVVDPDGTRIELIDAPGDPAALPGGD